MHLYTACAACKVTGAYSSEETESLRYFLVNIFSVYFPFQFLIEGNAQVCEFTDHLDIGTTYGDVKVCDGFHPILEV